MFSMNWSPPSVVGISFSSFDAMIRYWRVCRLPDMYILKVLVS